MTYWDTDGHHQEQVSPANLGKLEAKVLDLHVHLDEANDLIFAPKIMNFLTDTFQDDAVAFQCLYFENGSQQGCHQDTAFVYVDPPYQFAASWIALEDVVPGSGELFYYPGSQKIDDLIFQGGNKELRGGDPDGPNYSNLLESIAEGAGLTKQFLHIKAGESLMWAADLMHGGAPITTKHTRRSLVTHYCPLKAVVPYAKHVGREPRRVRDRGWVIGAH
jgi:ectoine hydroxylase-related dioxygenase (phytanoyl-CoA dioxygenase family)